MKKILILLFFNSIISCAQNHQHINNQATSFQIKTKNNTIDFVVFDTIFNKKKPVFIFLQGSTPTPLFAKFNDGVIDCLPISVFDYKEIKKYYHLILISKPGIPLLVAQKDLDKHYYFVENPDKPEPLNFPVEYLKGDNLENYVFRTQKVIQYLLKQKWVDKSKLIIVGHSQGSQIAPRVALANKNVTHIGLLSPNPFGRIEENIRKARKKAECGMITWEKADSIMQKEYNFLKMLYKIENIKEEAPSLLSWKSFSKPAINDWLKLNIPLFIAYGTADVTSDLCDEVPLYFIRKKKDNLTLKRYLNLEHSFFERNEKGQINYEKSHFNEVMVTFINWTLK